MQKDELVRSLSPILPTDFITSSGDDDSWQSSGATREEKAVDAVGLVWSSEASR